MAEGYTVVVKDLTNDVAKEVEIDPEDAYNTEIFVNRARPQPWELRVQVKDAAGEVAETYTVEISKNLTLKSMELSVDGTKAPLNFSGARKDFSVTIPADAKTAQLAVVPSFDSYKVLVNDTPVEDPSNITVDISQISEITIKAQCDEEGAEDAEGDEYTITLDKKGLASTTISAVPEEALVVVYDSRNDRVWPNEDGTFPLMEGQNYSNAWKGTSGKQIIAYGPQNEDGTYPTTPILTGSYTDGSGDAQVKLYTAGKYVLRAVDTAEMTRGESFPNLPCGAHLEVTVAALPGSEMAAQRQEMLAELEALFARCDQSAMDFMTKYEQQNADGQWVWDYLAGSAEKGIGAIGNVETTNAQYKRLDDPTGADAAKLTDSFTAAEMADGTLVTKLNGASAGNAWTNGPTISSAKHVVRMTNKNLNSMTAGTYKQSGGMAQFENTKYDITVTYSDGSTEVIKVTQCQINGLDLNTAGYQLVTATYKGYAMMFGANVNADGAPSDETVTKPVISAIDRIGDVTLDSKEAIEAARAAYDALTDAQKVLVSSYETLVTAEKKLAELTNQAAVDDVANVINAIGPVSKDSGSAIQAARAAYNALTDAQKALVPADVLKKLTDAEAAYAALTTGTTGTGGGFGNSGKKDTTKTDAKNDAKTVKSGSTGDAGVTLYVGMALVAVLAGAAVVARKRKEN